MSDSPNNCATKTGPSCWHTHTYREREERENARARERVFSVFPSENVSRRALVAHATARIKWNENPARKSHIGWGRRFGKHEHLRAPEHHAEHEHEYKNGDTSDGPLKKRDDIASFCAHVAGGWV